MIDTTGYHSTIQHYPALSSTIQQQQWIYRTQQSAAGKQQSGAHLSVQCWAIVAMTVDESKVGTLGQSWKIDED